MPPIRKAGCACIPANKVHTVLYTGVTSDLRTRTRQHRELWYPNSFTARCNCIIEYETTIAAIAEEKRIRGGSRADKLALIRAVNPDRIDLWERVHNW